MLDWKEQPYEAHAAAKANAAAAGDQQAVAEIDDRLGSYPEHHVGARRKALDAGDYEAAEQITKRYDKAFGKVTQDTWADYAPVQDAGKLLYEKTTGLRFNGNDQDAAQWAMDHVYDLEYGTVSQIKQVANWASGGMDETEMAAYGDLFDAYDKMPVSWKGAGKAAMTMIDPTESPETYTPGILAKPIKKGIAMAGRKQLRKQWQKKLRKSARDKFGERAAEAAATDMANKGALLGGKKLAADALTVAPAGAAYGAGADITRQVSTTDEIDQGQAVGAGLRGAAMGGALGVGVGKLMPGSGRDLKQGREFVKGSEAYGGSDAAQVMQRVADEHGIDIAKAGADEIDIVFRGATQEPKANMKLIRRELNDMAKQGLIPESVNDNLGEIGKARRRGDTGQAEVNRFGEIKPEAEERFEQLLGAMEAESMKLADSVNMITRVTQRPGMAEELLNNPAINVAADFLPAGYIATRAGGKIAGMIRRGGTGKALQGELDAAKTYRTAGDNTFKGQLKYGPDGEYRTSGHDEFNPNGIGEMGEMAFDAAETGAARRAATDSTMADLTAARQGRFYDKANPAAKADPAFSKLRAKAAARAAARDAAMNRNIDTTAHGGPQGNWGLNKRWAATDVDSALSRMQDEAVEGGNAALAREIQSFRKDYMANLDNRKLDPRGKVNAEGVFYNMAERLEGRVRPMSDEAFRNYTGKGRSVNRGAPDAQAWNKAHKGVKKSMAERDAVLRAQAQAPYKAAKGAKEFAGETARSQDQQYMQLHGDYDARMMATQDLKAKMDEPMTGEFLQGNRTPPGPVRPQGNTYEGLPQGAFKDDIQGAPPWQQQAGQFGQPAPRLPAPSAMDRGRPTMGPKPQGPVPIPMRPGTPPAPAAPQAPPVVARAQAKAKMAANKKVTVVAPKAKKEVIDTSLDAGQQLGHVNKELEIAAKRIVNQRYLTDAMRKVFTDALQAIEAARMQLPPERLIALIEALHAKITRAAKAGKKARTSGRR